MENKLYDIYLAIKSNPIDHIGLLGGSLGHIFFLSHYFHYTKNDEVFQTLEYTLNQLIENVSQCDSLRYGDGLAGLGWGLTYLVNQDILQLDLGEFLSDIDEVVVDNMQNYIAKKDYDFLHGLIGQGVYLLERNNFEAVNMIIDELDNNAIKSEEGICWLSHVFNKDYSTREVYNISLAHGSASVISFLCKCIKKDNRFSNRAKALIAEAVRFIRNQRLEDAISLFPGTCCPHHSTEKSHSRLSWCYGDMGIGLAFWQAGEVFNDSSLKQEAIDIYTHAAKRQSDLETGIVEAGICHGASGVAHMFNRMYFNTMRPEFKTTAERWMTISLSMATFDNGAAGFKSKGENNTWIKDLSFLNGISGIGLAYLSHLQPQQAVWDKALLMS